MQIGKQEITNKIVCYNWKNNKYIQKSVIVQWNRSLDQNFYLRVCIRRLDVRLGCQPAEGKPPVFCGLQRRSSSAAQQRRHLKSSVYLGNPMQSFANGLSVSSFKIQIQLGQIRILEDQNSQNTKRPKDKKTKIKKIKNE